MGWKTSVTVAILLGSVLMAAGSASAATGDSDLSVDPPLATSSGCVDSGSVTAFDPGIPVDAPGGEVGIGLGEDVSSPTVTVCVSDQWTVPGCWASVYVYGTKVFELCWI